MNIFNEMMNGISGDSGDDSTQDESNARVDVRGAVRKTMSAKSRGKARAEQLDLAEEEGSDDAFRPSTSKRAMREQGVPREAGAEASNGRARAERGQMVRLEGGRLVR